MSRYEKTWTPAADALLAEEWGKGTPIAEIGHKLQLNGFVPNRVTDKAVSMRRHALKLPARLIPEGMTSADYRWTRAQIDTLVREWPKGTSTKRIGMMCGGRKPSAVQAKRVALMLAPRQQGRKDTIVRKKNAVECITYLPIEIEAKVRAAAETLGLSRSSYLARLIAREHTPREQAQAHPLGITRRFG